MKSIKNGIGIWIVLAFIALPFPFFILPTFGIKLSLILFPITNGIASLFIYETTEFSPTSDSFIYFIQTALLILPCFIFILLNQYFKWISIDKLETFIHLLIVYILSLFLFKYGADKLFKHQFYDAEPNILFTPVGQLSKDILFWTSMGSSYSYNIFMSILEIIPAILLLWKRTRLLGIIISVGVLGNILVLNFSFDITVKLLSSLLFLSSLYVLSYYFKPLWNFFILQRTTEPVKDQELFSKPIIKRAVKGIVIVFILSETFLSFISSREFNGDNSVKIEYYGAYQVENFSGTSKLFNETKRFFIHSKGYLITESNAEVFEDYHAVISKNNIHLTQEKIDFTIVQKENSTLLKWTEDETKNLLKFTKIDIENLPLSEDNFHWFVEDHSTVND